MKLYRLLIALLLTLPALGQTVITSTQCAKIGVSPSDAVVGIQVTGTWTGTLQPQGTIQGQTAFNVQVTPSTSTTAQSTITGNGAFFALVAGYSTFQVCGATVATGSATVVLNGSQAPAGSGAGAPPVSNAFSALTSSTNTTATMHVGTGASLDATGSGTITATGMPYSGNTAGSNTAAKTEGTGGSLSPTGLGQVAGSQIWIPTGPVTLPTQGMFSATLTGGTIGSGQVLQWSYTVTSALGESLPSPTFQVNNSTAGCTSGSSCTFTMAAPTIPAGYLSWTTYWCDLSAGCTAPVKVLACTNLAAGVPCTVTSGTLDSGIAMPTTNSSFIQPANIQPTSCPPSVTPYVFGQTNDGNYQTWAGMDTNTANGNVGVLTWCRKTFFTDMGTDPVGFNNGLAVFAHQAGTNTSASNQDRALSVTMITPAGDTATRYALEAVQIETDLNGHPNINGSPDGEWTSLTATSADNSDADHTYGAGGAAVARLLYTKNGAGGTSSGYRVLRNLFNINQGTFIAGAAAYGTDFVASNSTGATVNNLFIAAYGCTWITATTITNGQFCLWQHGTTAPPGTANYLIRADAAGVASWLNGPVTISEIDSNAVADFPLFTSAVLHGSLNITQPVISGTGVASTSCSGGASSYQYTLVGVGSNGGTAPATAINTSAACTNPLTSGNPVTITINTTSLPTTTARQFSRIDVYRTGGPMGTGKIGSLTCVAGAPAGNGCSSFSDTGLTASGTAPTINTAGSVSAPFYKTATNCAASGTAANPSVVSCSAAAAGAVFCDVAASAGTCTVNTTAVTTTSRIFITPSAADGTELSQTCNTALTFGTAPLLAAKVAGTSFTINMPTVTTNGACFEYFIVN